ncbi:reverse transcriptase domain-containing protein [Tanacetum coccineum]
MKAITTRSGVAYEGPSIPTNPSPKKVVEREAYALEFLGFPNSSGGNPTPTSEPFTSEFVLEEIEAYLKDDSIHGKSQDQRGKEYFPTAVLELCISVTMPFGLFKGFPIKSFDGVCIDRKLLRSSKLVMKDPPRAIIGPISPLKKVMSKYGVTHRLATAYHPQTSGQVEVSNRGLKRILERTVGENHASWSDKLDNALWAFRTAFKTPIGCTPYKLVYGKSCHLPIELEHKAYWALKHANFDLKTVGDHRKLQLNELNELRDQAYENSLIYKERTKKLHDSKIKNRIFNVGDRVLLFNSRLKIFSGKLKTRWSGPFTITKVFPYGTIELSQPDGPNFKVNGHRVKHYFGGDLPPKKAHSKNKNPRLEKFVASCQLTTMLRFSKVEIARIYGKLGVLKPKVLVSLDTSLCGVSKSWSLSRKVGMCRDEIATWDDLAFKLIILGWNMKHRILQNIDPCLWAFCTAFKTPIGCTPYKLVYGKSCHLPIELEHKAYWALKHANFDLKTAGDHRKLQLNELNELRDQAYENSLIYKERKKKLHDSKIKNRIFNVGYRVLLFNSHLKIFSGKLKTRWSGPFTITKVFPYGTIELSQPDGPNFKVNGHRVKHYFGGDLPPKVVQDLHTFSKDE